MKAEKLAAKYIMKAEKALSEIKISEDCFQIYPNNIQQVIKEAERYLNDAKYYLMENKFETSLSSVSYSEGLLDGVKMLGLVKFSW